ncbi:fibrillarin-like rRNA/tRNA 2'-O-methyltransferase, partial [Candidatus Woesearchaeota archaeon]|nr:fibrillarin-like rRNA/tRNA 2'-O-methyltransferase [Candidatus Woesearchaeota archaeon]
INKNKILTLSFNPGKRVYDENTISIKNQEYREWDPNKSKLCAAIFNGLNNISLNDNMNILYLGSSTGTTVSHLSDININGKIFALDFAPRVHRELLFLAKDRKNIFPLMADVTQPLTYFSAIEQADLIFQDIAQKDQLTPFVNNIKLYLKKNGIAIISVKARSIDVVKRPSDIFKDFTLNLGKYVNIMEKRLLDPYEKDHCLFVVKQKK